jgi:hypothetical protein
MTPIARRKRYFVLVWVVLSFCCINSRCLPAFVATVDAFPYLLLKNAAAKCVQVEAPQETTLFVDYDVPGA